MQKLGQFSYGAKSCCKVMSLRLDCAKNGVGL